MNYSKTIVCLANSRKTTGRCIAGKEILDDGYSSWVRPISGRPSAEVSEEERRYDNGQDSQVLDILDIPMIRHDPVHHQLENHVIDSDYYWEKTSVMPWAQLNDLLDEPSTLWVNGSSTYFGLNDRVAQETAYTMGNSLVLIKPESLTVVVDTEGAEFGNPRRRVRAHFNYNGAQYILIVTDPLVERSLLAKPDGDHELNNAFLCVSLAEAHTDGYCYKLVASIIGEQPL